MTLKQTIRNLAISGALLVVFSGPGGAQQGEEVRDTFGAWEVRCAAGTDSCVMAQKGKGANGNDVIDVRLRKLNGVKSNDGQDVPAAIQVAAPLGVMLQAGVQIKVDAKNPRSAPFELCAEVGCFVRQPVSADFLAEMRAGSKAVVTVIAAPNNRVDTEISLSGFTKAYNSLK